MDGLHIKWRDGSTEKLTDMRCATLHVPAERFGYVPDKPGFERRPAVSPRASSLIAVVANGRIHLVDWRKCGTPSASTTAPGSTMEARKAELRAIVKRVAGSVRGERPKSEDAPGADGRAAELRALTKRLAEQRTDKGGRRAELAALTKRIAASRR